MQEASHRMVPHIETVAEHEVRYGATLDADVVELEHVQQVWSPRDVEAVADSLGAQQDGVVNLLAIAAVCLARVHHAMEGVAVVDGFGLCLIDLREELIDRPREVLLLHQIERYDHFRRNFLALKVSFNLTLDVALGCLESRQTLQSTNHNFHLEQLESRLNQILHSLEYFELALHADRLVVIVEDAAEDVLELDDRNDLLDAVLADAIEHLLKELVVVVQFCRGQFVSQEELNKILTKGEVKFRLERFPHRVRLLSAHCISAQLDPSDEVLVKSS